MLNVKKFNCTQMLALLSQRNNWMKKRFHHFRLLLVRISEAWIYEMSEDDFRSSEIPKYNSQGLFVDRE